MKSHPHPERPDRLQAIAASLRAAGKCMFLLKMMSNFRFCVFFGKSWMLLSVLTGVFPTKVFPIPAREVTLDELQKVSELKLLFDSILEAI